MMPTHLINTNQIVSVKNKNNMVLVKGTDLRVYPNDESMLRFEQSMKGASRNGGLIVN